MKVILSIQNQNSKSVDLELLGWLFNAGAPNLGLPENTVVDVTIKDKDGTERKTTYEEFLKQSIYDPIALFVENCTNNRQLYFYTRTFLDEQRPIVPQFTEKGLIHHEDPSDVWNPDTHNIADTHEIFIMNGKEVIKMKLKPKQLFEIEFEIIAKKVSMKNLST